MSFIFNKIFSLLHFCIYPFNIIFCLTKALNLQPYYFFIILEFFF